MPTGPELSSWTRIRGELAVWSIEFSLSGTLSRTLALWLPSSEWLVFNPGREVPDLARNELLEHGSIAGYFSPNAFHHRGVASWRRAAGDAPVHASAIAHSRLARKLGFAPALLRDLEGRLPDGLEVIELEGTRTGESWLAWGRGAERTWAVGDALFHFERTPRNAWGLMLRATGGAPGLRMSKVFRRFAAEDPAALRASIERQLVTGPPARLVPCHGTLLSPADPDRLRDAIAEVVRERLG